VTQLPGRPPLFGAARLASVQTWLTLGSRHEQGIPPLDGLLQTGCPRRAPRGRRSWSTGPMSAAGSIAWWQGAKAQTDWTGKAQRLLRRRQPPRVSLERTTWHSGQAFPAAHVGAGGQIFRSRRTGRYPPTRGLACRCPKRSGTADRERRVRGPSFDPRNKSEGRQAQDEGGRLRARVFLQPSGEPCRTTARARCGRPSTSSGRSWRSRAGLPPPPVVSLSNHRHGGCGHPSTSFRTEVGVLRRDPFLQPSGELVEPRRGGRYRRQVAAAPSGSGSMALRRLPTPRGSPTPPGLARAPDIARAREQPSPAAS